MLFICSEGREEVWNHLVSFNSFLLHNFVEMGLVRMIVSKVKTLVME